MHELKSVIGGASIILGSHVNQFASCVTILVAVQTPPEYADS